MIPPGCITKLHENRGPVKKNAEEHKDDDGIVGKTSKEMLTWWSLYDDVFSYATTGSGEHQREYITLHAKKYHEEEFQKKTDAMTEDLSNYPDPKDDELPTFWKNWTDEFNLCWNAYGEGPMIGSAQDTDMPLLLQE